MKYEFHVYQMQVEDHQFWVAKSKVLNGCLGQGDSLEEAISELESNEEEWIDTAKEYGIPIPPSMIVSDKTYSGKFMVRVSPIVHENAARAAADQSVSLNQFVNNAIIYYTAVVNSPTSFLRGYNYDYDAGSISSSSPSNINYSFRFDNSERKEM